MKRRALIAAAAVAPALSWMRSVSAQAKKQRVIVGVILLLTASRKVSPVQVA